MIRKIEVPVVVKEVGNGLSADLARTLISIGVAGIDVAGAGGTSWSEVEANRQADPLIRKVAHNFAAWGIPTAHSLIDVRREAGSLPVFASGGLRTGIDIAKAVRLGATLCGVAAPALGAADEDTETVIKHMQCLIEELKIVAFCTGAQNLEDLTRVPLRGVNDWSTVDL